MAGTLDFQIRPPSPSYSDAVSLISPLQEEIDCVTELDMSVRTHSVRSFDDSAIERIDRHESYYIPSGDTVFMVENTLFRAHQYFFVRESAYFRTVVFPSSNFRQALVGTSDAHPIILGDVTSIDFARLLWVFYDENYNHDATSEVWSSILRVAHKWGFHKVKDLAVRELEKTALPPVDKAVLARDCEVGRDWLETAYAELGAREAPLTKEEGQRLGLDAVIQLAEVREKIRERRSQPIRPASPQHEIAPQEVARSRPASPALSTVSYHSSHRWNAPVINCAKEPDSPYARSERPLSEPISPIQRSIHQDEFIPFNSANTVGGYSDADITIVRSVFSL